MASNIVNVSFEINEEKAFWMLCDALGITDLIKSEDELYIYMGKVCRINRYGIHEEIDDRADLFAALRNVAAAIWPNTEFRSDPYITNYWRDDHDE